MNLFLNIFFKIYNKISMIIIIILLIMNKINMNSSITFYSNQNDQRMSLKFKDLTQSVKEINIPVPKI